MKFRYRDLFGSGEYESTPLERGQVTWPWPTPTQKCPVCEGRGIVPHGFYSYPAGQQFSSTDTTPEKCRTCDGGGVVRG
jgi:DnaJ-class molecular chaperone